LTGFAPCSDGWQVPARRAEDGGSGGAHFNEVTLESSVALSFLPRRLRPLARRPQATAAIQTEQRHRYVIEAPAQLTREQWIAKYSPTPEAIPALPPTIGPRGLFERLGRRAGMPFTIFPHMLRHACGYALANAGHDTRALQAWLGHKNIQHTVRYTELAPDRFKNFWRD
jgi:integrase